MDNQGWIDVPIRRRSVKKEISTNSDSDGKVKQSREKEEDLLPKMRIRSESLQQLIRKRIQQKINQEKADFLCAFPRNTFKNIESNRLLPSDSQRRRIQHVFDIVLCMDSVSDI